MVTVFICVKVAGDPRKIPKKIEKFFDFLGLEGSTVEDKRKSFIKRIKEAEDSK